MTTGNRIANLFLILCAAASLAALAYAASYFYSTYYLSGRNPSLAGILIYFVLPGALAAGFTASLRLSPKIKTNLTVLTITVGLCLVLSNLAAGYLTDRDPPLLKEVERLRRGGERAFPRVIPRRLFRLQGDDTYLPVLKDSQGYLQPLGGISKVRTVLCNETGRFVTYESDSFGFNNPPGLAGRKARILALGDSFAHGFCVPPENNFVSLIGEAFPPTYNLGAGGNGPLLELAGLKEYGSLIEPELVLWFFFEGNDLNNLEMERLHTLLIRYLEEGFTQNLAQSRERIDHGLIRFLEKTMAGEKTGLGRKLADTILLRHLRRLLGLGLAQKRRNGAGESGLKQHRPNWPLFKRVMKIADRTASSWGGRLIFVYLPEQQRFLGKSRPSLERERKELLEMMDGLGIPVIDMVPIFASQSDPLALFNIPDKPSHYNKAGHAAVAHEVNRFLQANQGG